MSQQSPDTATILIVDDNTWMQRILAKILMSYGLKARFACNAFDGVALAVQDLPQAVILDVVMPEINGLQTLRLLKTIDCTKHIPVLVITAAPDPKTLSQALSLGAAGFIHKPFTRASIHDKLAQVLHKDLLPPSDHQEFKLSDDELDSMVNEKNSNARLSTPSGNNEEVGPLHLRPAVNIEGANTNTASVSPAFNVMHRRGNVGVRRASAEHPDEAELREMLKRSNHR